MFTTSHEPGALVDVLGVFRDAGINLSHIDKRPSGRENWNYSFFIDADAHQQDEILMQAIEKARLLCTAFKVLDPIREPNRCSSGYAGAMAEASRTTTALLNNLHDEHNDAAWREFDDRYRPILLGFSRRLGLPDADAVDVAQETMIQFIKEYREGKYDRERGDFVRGCWGSLASEWRASTAREPRVASVAASPPW